MVFTVEAVALGFLAGTLGGLVGVGGSTIIIPGLTLVLGYNQHLYQAAAMFANIAVSIPAAIRHRQAGTMSGPILKWILLIALLGVLVGVWLSNLTVFRGVQGGLWLGRVLAVFLVYVIVVNVRRIYHSFQAADTTKDTQEFGQNSCADQLISNYRWRAGSVGAVIGINRRFAGDWGGG